MCTRYILQGWGHWDYKSFPIILTTCTQVVCQNVCLLAGVCQGFHSSRRYETSRQEEWRHTRDAVHTRAMLECEREYQEHLLLSVMPAYIAAEASGDPLQANESTVLICLQRNVLKSSKFWLKCYFLAVAKRNYLTVDLILSMNVTILSILD